MFCCSLMMELWLDSQKRWKVVEEGQGVAIRYLST